jgi:hypothetical protein
MRRGIIWRSLAVSRSRSVVRRTVVYWASFRSIGEFAVFGGKAPAFEGSPSHPTRPDPTQPAIAHEINFVIDFGPFAEFILSAAKDSG